MHYPKEMIKMQLNSSCINAEYLYNGNTGRQEVGVS